MPDPKPTTVLWPDLSRFGLELTVAFNPSIGRNFLRLAVKDRNLVTSASGLVPGKDDFFRIMRDAGFAYQPSETEAKRIAAYREAILRGASLDERNEATEREVNRLYFYSPNIAVKKEILKRIAPALADSDFRQMPISAIKHFDFRYLDDARAAALRKSQQTFTGGEPGVFYIIPADRDLLQRLGSRATSLQSILKYENPSRATAPADPDMESVSAFNPIPALSRFVGTQTLLPDGAELRTITAGAVVIGYPSYDDAVSANGGDVEGIERVQLPEALPVAFDYPARRVIAVKDVRFLEFGTVVHRDPEDIANAHGAQYHWDFLDRVAAVGREVVNAIDSGVFAEDAVDDRASVEVARAEIMKIRELMSVAVAGLSRSGHEDQLTSSDLLLYSGVPHARFPQFFGPDFASFIAEFPALCARVEKRGDELDAEDEMERGIKAAMTRVHSVEAEQRAERREDAGEKIGGARKDYARRWLSAEELGGMTLRERVDVVTKDNVWPTPDYAAMEAQGVRPEVAYCIRELRNALPTNPYRGGFNTKRNALLLRAQQDLTLEQCESFVKVVSLVRDALAEVKSKEDLLAAVINIRQQADLGRYSWNPSHWFFDGAGYHFTNKVLPDLDMGTDGTVRNSWYLDRFVLVAESKTKGEWSWAGKKQRVRLTEDQAEAVVARRERPEPEVPHLEHIERSGEDYRQGRDVNEQILMEVFGFRAVEYGNWLPQDERQTVLNHSFDAFMDLAAALQLPPKAMSLGGDLALAFGSRGRGGKNAARAHYEPARNVINLTRLSGAGALAHEWGHGLDYFLAKSCDVSQTHALTERAEKTRRVQQPIAAAFMTVVEEARVRYRAKEEIIAELVMVDVGVEKKLPVAEVIRNRLEDFINNLDRLLPEDKRGTVFREFARAELDKLLVPVDGEPGLVQLSGADTFVRNISTALKLQMEGDWKERLHPDTLKFPVRLAQWAQDRCAKVDLVKRQYEAKSYPAASVFLKDAEYFDSFRSKPYWATRVEMFARAFESWVQDGIESQPGQCSQYLVCGKREQADTEHSGYPRGEERARINAAMSSFFQDHRIELLRRMGVVQPEKTSQADLEVA